MSYWSRIYIIPPRAIGDRPYSLNAYTHDHNIMVTQDDRWLLAAGRDTRDLYCFQTIYIKNNNRSLQYCDRFDRGLSVKRKIITTVSLNSQRVLCLFVVYMHSVYVTIRAYDFIVRIRLLCCR